MSLPEETMDGWYYKILQGVQLSSKKFENASQFKISATMISMFKSSRTIILVFQHGIYLNLTNTYVSGFNKHSDDTANLLFAVADRSTSCERRGSWIVTEICKLRCLRTSPNNGYKRCINIWKLCTRPVLAGIVEMPVTQKVQLENTSGTKNSRLDKTCSGALEDTWFDENIWKQRIWEAEWKIDVVQQDYAGLSFKNRAITWTHKCNQICTQCKAETSQLQKSALAFSFRLTVCPAAFRAAAASCRDLINGIVRCFLYLVTLHKKNTLAKFQAVGSRIWWYDTCFILFWSHESHESHDICQLYISAVDILSGSVLSKLREGHRPQTLRVQQHSAEQRVTRHGTSEHSTVQLARCNWGLLIQFWYTWGILF
jgi:hypothetical protein